MLLLKRNCYVTHKAIRNKNCAALFVVLSYCNLVSSGNHQVSREKCTTGSSMMWLSCSAQLCPVDRHGKTSKEKQKQEKTKIYLHYYFKDNSYPRLYERFISYRAVNKLSVIKINLLVLQGRIVDVYFDSHTETRIDCVERMQNI